MMVILFEIFNLAAVHSLLVGIPESAGLLIFGIGLTAAAVLIRRVLGRRNAEKTDK